MILQIYRRSNPTLSSLCCNLSRRSSIHLQSFFLYFLVLFWVAGSATLALPSASDWWETVWETQSEETCRQSGPERTICARSSDIHPYFLSHTLIHTHTPPFNTPPPSDNSWKLDSTRINITPALSVPQSILPLLPPPLIISTNLYLFVSFSLESPPSLPVFSPNYIKDNPVFRR